jgi:hypothetical protein
VPANDTAVIWARPVPLIVTVAPTGPCVGSREMGPGWAWAGVPMDVMKAATSTEAVAILPTRNRTRGLLRVGRLEG